MTRGSCLLVLSHCSSGCHCGHDLGVAVILPDTNFTCNSCVACNIHSEMVNSTLIILNVWYYSHSKLYQTDYNNTNFYMVTLLFYNLINKMWRHFCISIINLLCLLPLSVAITLLTNYFWSLVWIMWDLHRVCESYSSKTTWNKLIKMGINTWTSYT